MTRLAWFTAGFVAAAAVLARWAVRNQAVTVTWAKPPTRLGSAGTPAKGNVPNHPSDPGGTVSTDPAHTGTDVQDDLRRWADALEAVARG